MVSICLLATRQHAGGIVLALGKVGKQREHVLDSSADHAVALQPEFEVLPHGQAGYTWRPREHTDAEMGDLVGPQACDRTALKAICPTGGNNPISPCRRSSGRPRCGKSGMTSSPWIDLQIGRPAECRPLADQKALADRAPSEAIMSPPCRDSFLHAALRECGLRVRWQSPRPYTSTVMRSAKANITLHVVLDMIRSCLPKPNGIRANALSVCAVAHASVGSSSRMISAPPRW